MDLPSSGDHKRETYQLVSSRSSSGHRGGGCDQVGRWQRRQHLPRIASTIICRAAATGWTTEIVMTLIFIQVFFGATDKRAPAPRCREAARLRTAAASVVL